MSNLKQTLQEEKEKLSKLSLPEKIGYIFSYYKLQIAVIVTVIAIAVILIVHFVNKKEELLIGTFINTSVTSAGYDVLSDDFLEHVGGDSRSQMVRVLETAYIDYSGQDMSEFNRGEVMKITAMISNQALDFMIMDESALQNYAPQDAFRDLSQLLPADLYEELEPMIVTATSLESGETYPAAIDISGTAYAEKYELSQKPSYLGFLGLSPRSDMCLEFLDYFLSLE